MTILGPSTVAMKRANHRAGAMKPTIGTVLTSEMTKVKKSLLTVKASAKVMVASDFH